MKLTELIETAQKALAEHGDIEVMIDYDRRGYKVPSTQVAPQLIEDEEGGPDSSDEVYFWVHNYDN